MENFIHGEVILGGFTLFVGGFVLRATGRYDFIVVGGIFLMLGIYRLFQRSETLNQNPMDEDRVLVRLKTSLDSNYTIAVDFPLEDESIDYLIMGPGGITVLYRFECRGYIQGGKNSREWLCWDSKEDYQNDDKPFKKVLNPIVKNSRKIKKLKALLENCYSRNEELNITNKVILYYNRVEGPVTNFEEIIEIGRITNQLRNPEDEPVHLPWEQVNDLEECLSMSEY